MVFAIVVILLFDALCIGAVIFGIAYCMHICACGDCCGDESPSEKRERKMREGREKLLAYHQSRPYNFESREYVREHRDDDDGWFF